MPLLGVPPPESLLSPELSFIMKFHSPELLTLQQPFLLGEVLRRVHLYLEQFLTEPTSTRIIVHICSKLLIYG